MAGNYLKVLVIIGFLANAGNDVAWARDGHTIRIPMRSKLTPVQRLNREGVDAIMKGSYQRAEAAFYRAYLYDPGDPFTLNNLGYIAELEGQLDQAQRFYALASKQGSNADIDRSNVKHLEGKPMKDALINLQDLPMRMDRMNIDAMRLLSQDQGFEAVGLLKHALSLDPQNPFTLNNLGVAMEATGDLESAENYYRSAAAVRSSAPASVSLDSSWRGKPVSEMAAASARRLEKRLRNTGTSEARAVMLTVRGVFAANQNDWTPAREDFLRAYSLDPNSAFSLNNRAYVAERDGDLETAQFYYEKARRAENAGARVGLATDLSAQGRSLFSVAEGSTDKVDVALDQYSQRKRQETGPIELTPRGPGGTSTEPQPQRPSPEAPTPAPPSPQPQNQ